MKITVYNIKGGVGKTAVAVNLALSLGVGIITNEPFSPIDSALDEKKLLRLEKTQAIPDLPDDFDVIFDFGGYVDQRITDALCQSDLVIVPTINEYLDLQTTIDTLHEIEEYSKNPPVIVVNRADNNDFAEARNVLVQYYPLLRIYQIKKSRALPSVIREGRSIREMVAEGGLRAWNYRVVAEQFETIIKHINQLEVKNES